MIRLSGFTVLVIFSLIALGQTDVLAQDAKTDSTEETAVRALYQQIIDAWNKRDGKEFAGAFAPDGQAIGFDGSEMIGKAQIEATLVKIFAHHPTGAYVANIRSVRFLNTETAILRADTGMIPPEKKELNAELNAIQIIVAVKRAAKWHIVQLQNTPTEFSTKQMDDLKQLIK